MKTSTGGRRRERRRTADRDLVVGYLFLAPSVVLYLCFLAGPFFAALILSFFQWDLLGSPHSPGLHNYARLWADPNLRASLANTTVFTIASVILHIVFGLLLAVAVNRSLSKPVLYFVRTVYVFPLLVSWSVVSLIWRYMLDPNFGIVNYYLGSLGISAPVWLASPTWALPALIGIDLWHTLGFTFIILLAGLQTIPREFYEAALVDGAGAWRQFWSITIPLLSPTLFFAVVITFIGAFQIFDPMFIITSGGPGTATRSLVQDIYLEGFRNFDLGYASAISMILLVVTMAATGAQFRLARYWVQYE